MCCSHPNRLYGFPIRLVPNVGFDNCTNDTMRLTGGSTNSEGRVEICYNGVWGSICDSNWNGIEAKVVCKSLGHQFYGKCSGCGD